MFRFPTRWAGDDPGRARTALLMLLSLRGTPVLYQGDEIGMGDVELAHEDMRDPLGVRYWPHYAGRDAGRTPMQWRNIAGGGFTEPGVIPWLPLGEVALVNVRDQRADPSSMLTLARDLIAFRRGHGDFCLGPYQSVASPPGLWRWRRGDRYEVILNLSDDTAVVEGVEGTVAICSERSRDALTVTGRLRVDAGTGLIVERPTSP
jgi:alpha-glucosidase